jgi:hypothetical protein
MKTNNIKQKWCVLLHDNVCQTTANSWVESTSSALLIIKLLWDICISKCQWFFQPLNRTKALLLCKLQTNIQNNSQSGYQLRLHTVTPLTWAGTEAPKQTLRWTLLYYWLLWYISNVHMITVLLLCCCLSSLTTWAWMLCTELIANPGLEALRLELMCFFSRAFLFLMSYSDDWWVCAQQKEAHSSAWVIKHGLLYVVLCEGCYIWWTAASWILIVPASDNGLKEV